MTEPEHGAGSVLQLLKDGDNPTARDQERVRDAVWARLGLVGATATVAATGVHVVASQGAHAATAAGASVAPGALGAGAMGANSIAASAVGAKAAWFVTVVKVGLAATLVGAGGWYGARVLYSEPEPSAPEAAQGVAPAVVLAAPVTPTETAEPVFAPPEQPTEPSAQSNDTSRARAATAGDALDSEVALLTEAQRSLAAGRYAAALTSLDKHAARYPRGALASERDASRAIALCKSGSLSKGQAVGKRYLSKHANAPLRARVQTACKLEE
jgi:hypothetical protein